MIAAFAAAYMSTIGTQLNWGASYVINDFYRRFIVRNASERHYVIASQLATLLLMVLSLIITFYLASIESAWKLLMVTGAGTGTVLLLRWFWWRINAWSEIAAMIAAAAVSLFLQSRYRAAVEQRRPQAIRVFDADDRRHHDDRLAGGYVDHAARAAKNLWRSIAACGRPGLDGGRSPRAPATSSQSKAWRCSLSIGFSAAF